MKLAAVVLVSAVLGVSISACGSSSNNAATEASGSSTVYAARLNLARCLRAHGVNVPDPTASGGLPGGEGQFRQLRDSPNFQPALQACSKYVRAAFPRLNLTPAQRAQFQQAFVKFAECMRAHGVDIPDPTPGAGVGGGFGLRRAITPALRNSPAFQTALPACASKLPFRPGGRGGPPIAVPAPGG
jgi:hypothetical protein